MSPARFHCATAL
ncbi:unnamed protein product [Debaryomyces tyrocola]|nr:unnamed protein product [Debaryomyces tyrocola]